MDIISSKASYRDTSRPASELLLARLYWALCYSIQFGQRRLQHVRLHSDPARPGRVDQKLPGDTMSQRVVDLPDPRVSILAGGLHTSMVLSLR